MSTPNRSLLLTGKGFRPFFLLAGGFASVVALIWMAALSGKIELMGPLRGVSWHAHEMLFGFTLAVVAGFLLTAVENWTKQTTLRGPALFGFAGIWLAARIALLLPGWVGPALDLLVVPILMFGIGRPLLATKNKRNLPFVLLLGALWAANMCVYLDAAGLLPGAASQAHRMSVYVIAVIVLLITGRVVPMFTRNATGVPSLHNYPLVDRVAVWGTGGVAVLQLFPQTLLLSGVAGIAGIAVFIRMVPWFTPRLLGRPLLWVLHLGHAAIGSSLLLTAARPVLGPLGTGDLHALTVGGVGLLTIGMMSRVSLGHTGRSIQVGLPTAVSFVAVGIAALVRVLGPWFNGAQSQSWLWVAALAWSVGFLMFTMMYAGILLAPRPDGREG